MHIIDSGNTAAATGVKLARVQVIAAYPITPQTPLTEKLSEFVESGEMKAEYIPVESEHSALAVCIAASSTGARAFTATSANGLLYMHEQVHWAAGARLPLVMCVANRGVGAPWSIWNDHQDTMSQRDTGWIHLHAANHQQIIDTVIQSFRIAETVRVPVMVCYDGYLLSHTHMPFDVPDPQQVDAFLAGCSPSALLDPATPMNLNTVTLPDVRPDVRGDLAPGYMEIRHNLHQDMRRAIDVVGAVDQAFCDRFGRGGHPLFEPYCCDDADHVVLCMGSLSLQMRKVVDMLRAENIRAGVMGLRLFRPFPAEQLAGALGRAKSIAVFEKAISYGYEGPLATELKAALYNAPSRPVIGNYILGLGGRTIKTEDLHTAFKEFCRSPKTETDPVWIDLKL